ncbi:hypothetical protein EV126DRAFT_139111 [Verticillium dahliae]|nr:hypothetical protein EV126DRAFT_139111 [Verticillium dahliae]
MPRVANISSGCVLVSGSARRSRPLSLLTKESRVSSCFTDTDGRLTVGDFDASVAVPPCSTLEVVSSVFWALAYENVPVVHADRDTVRRHVSHHHTQFVRRASTCRSIYITQLIFMTPTVCQRTRRSRSLQFIGYPWKRSDCIVDSSYQVAGV